MTKSKSENSFGKAYKLCSHTAINELFTKGEMIKIYPFRLNYIKTELNSLEENPFKIVINVPKRNFKLATNRNRIKRILKEVVRNNKNLIESVLKKEKIHLNLFLNYQDRTEIKREILEKKYHLLIENLSKQIKS